MNAKRPLDFTSKMEGLKSFLTLTLSVGSVAAMINGVAWFILEPHVRPVLNVVNEFPELVTRMETLEAAQEPTPFIEFDGFVRVRPTQTPAGTVIRITYLVKKNFDCKTTVHVRFYDLINESFDVQYSYDYVGIQAPVTTTFQPFSISIKVPSDLPLGEWAYWPEIEPDENCPDRETRQPPQAVFNVIVPHIPVSPVEQ